MAETKTPSDRIEREYVIPLRHRWSIVPRYKRTNKAVKAIKEFLVRHMKIRDRDLSKIRIDKYLNEIMWARGIRSPPSRIKVLAIKEKDKDGEEIVRVTAVNMPANIKFKKLRKERIESKGKEIAKKKKEEKPAETTETPKAEEDKEKKGKEEENKSALVEAGKEMEKAAAKSMKHEKKQDMKQPKHQRRMALQK